METPAPCCARLQGFVKRYTLCAMLAAMGIAGVRVGLIVSRATVCVINRSYSVCEPIQNQTRTPSSSIARARYPMLTRAEWIGRVG